MSILGKRIREKRLEKGYGVRELARLAGVHQPTISQLENGKTDDVTTGVAKRLAIALGTSVDYLIATHEITHEDTEHVAS